MIANLVPFPVNTLLHHFHIHGGRSITCTFSLKKNIHGGHEQQQLDETLIVPLINQSNHLKTLNQLLCYAIRNHLLPIHNHFLARLVQLKAIDQAITFFSKIYQPDVFAWNMIIRGLTQTGRFADAIEFFHLMKRDDIVPNKFTFPSVIMSCGGLRALRFSSAAHGEIFKLGLNADGYTQHTLITAYGRCGCLMGARQVFDEMSEKDVVSWNTMISTFAHNSRPLDAVRVFRKMWDEGFLPREATIVSVLPACGELGFVDLGKWIESYAFAFGLEESCFLGSSLISMYSKTGKLSHARQVFDKMSSRGVFVWNAMIAGYAQNGCCSEAIDVFLNMRGRSDFEPDKVTLSAILPACASIGAVDLGLWIDSYAREKGLRTNIYVATALLDMYAKCGLLEDACIVFREMPEKNIVSWNTIISALAVHGHGHEAIKYFGLMREDGFVPNEVTFVGVLTACVHMGLLDEGCRFFALMKNEYGIVPEIEHYTCIVDLFARAGKLVEAYEFVQTMAIKPDAVVWGALLNACRNSRNAETSKRIMKKLLQLEPRDSGNYVIASNILRDAKQLDDAARVRGMMKERGVVKTPGCSWIEMESGIHEFHSGVILHAKRLDIRKMLTVLVEEMRNEGYMPSLV